MDMKHVKTFVTFSEEGTFQKTAQLLNYAPSTLSGHIRALEDEFHVKLVESVGRTARLTDAGNEFLPYAKSFLELYHDVSLNLSGFHNTADPLRIITTETVGLYRLAPVFMRFNQQSPSVKLSVRVGTSNYFPQLLANDDVDVAVCQRFSPPLDSRFSSIALY